MRAKTAFVLGLVLCAALTPAFAEYEDVHIPEDDFEEDEVEDSRALLIAHKYIKEGSVIQGTNMTVVINVVNVGKGAATNVKIKDTALDASTFTLISGTTSRVIEAIPSGRSAEIEFTYVPSSGGIAFVGEPAAIVYSPLYGQAHITQVLQSTTANVFIMTRLQSFQKKLLTLGRYASLGSLKTAADWTNSFILIAGTVALLAGLVLYTFVNTSRAESRRSAAVKALGADQ